VEVQGERAEKEKEKKKGGGRGGGGGRTAEIGHRLLVCALYKRREIKSRLSGSGPSVGMTHARLRNIDKQYHRKYMGESAQRKYVTAFSCAPYSKKKSENTHKRNEITLVREWVSPRV